MQHFKYATLRKLHVSPDLSYLKLFIKTNIKFLFTYPKTIWYSQRYNAGEKFILRDTNMFPYYYNIDQNNLEISDPINISVSLLTATKESFILRYPNIKPRTFSEKDAKKVQENFDKNFEQLNNILNIRLEDHEKLDLPVAVYARILLAAVVANSNSDKTLKNSLTKEVYELCIKKFLDKIEFADIESISAVIYSLSAFQFFDDNVWKLLIDNLESKSFVPEYTEVVNKSPHIFRYEELDSNGFSSSYLDDFGNKVFLNGYFEVFLCFYGLLRASQNGVEVKSALINIINKFPEIKDEVHKLASFP